MSLSYLIRGLNLYNVYGLSTDTKPSSPPDSCLFVEIDTSKKYYSQSGNWNEVLNTAYATNNFIYDEVPSGTINGINITFTLTHTPLTNSLRLSINGIKLNKTNDYTLSGNTITMIQIPWSGCSFLADYQY